MKKIVVGITLQNDKPLNQIFAANGLSQNVKFLYDIMELIGCIPYFLVSSQKTDSTVTVNKGNYRMVSFQQAFDSAMRIDLVLEAGVTVGDIKRERLRDKHGAKIVSVRYGPSMYLDMEQICYKPTMAGHIHVSEPDFLWTSPHYIDTIGYLSTLYNCEVAISPYIWEPDFVKRSFNCADHIETPNIYVMEPNISIVKNALIPMTIIEYLYRKSPKSFNQAFILNGLHFNNEEYFLNNIARNLTAFRAENNKGYFSGRYAFDEVFPKPHLLLSHQHENELNYLQLEAMYKGVPLVHNSASLADAGYYYSKADVSGGSKACEAAIGNTNIKQKMAADRKVIDLYSIHSHDNQQRYKQLIEQVLDS
jgi:hypothetical protein